jgi:hypothetical protein
MSDLRRSDVAPDQPLRLHVAAALQFPDGSMTASGLRREAKKGRLVIEKIANKDYTTLAAIEKMRELCRQQQEGRDAGAGRRGAMSKEESPMSGSSSTEDVKRALSRARMTLEELSRSLKPASSASTQHPLRKRKAP